MRSAFHWLSELEGLKVLDIGCGHGAFSIYAVSEGASAAALDVNMERLRFAAEQSGGMGLPVSFLCGCSERLPFPDGVFDLVVSRSTLQYTCIPEVMDQCMRVLKPGGALILVENMAHNPFLLLFRAFRRITGNRIRLGTYIGNKAGAIKGYATVSRMETLLSGLSEGGCCFYHLFRPLSLGLCQIAGQARWARFLDRGVEWLDKFLLKSIPPLRRFAWAGALWGRKRVGDQR